MLDRNLTVISVVRLERGSNKTTPRGKLSDIACHAIRRSGIRSTICTTALYSLPSSREVNEKCVSSIFCTSQRRDESRQFFKSRAAGVNIRHGTVQDNRIGLG